MTSSHTTSESVWREYVAQEADRCEHGVLPGMRCDDCLWNERRQEHDQWYPPGSMCSHVCGFCGRCQ